jgi:uncharacterized protein DUF1553/uncharacterized protein DUF1549/cytochrome c
MHPSTVPVRILALAAFLTATPLFAEITKEQTDFFEGKIRPIFSNKCYKCHSAQEGKSKGGLTLDTAEGLLKGGETGPGIVAGDPGKSLLIKAISYTDKELQMPPNKENMGKLADAEIAALTEWVKMGAPDPRKGKAGKLSGLTGKARGNWSYQPVKKPELPAIKNRTWCVTPVDAFILAKLEERNMVPSRDADKETLIRRAYFDLIGIPPSPREVVDFVSDTSPNAFVKIVDRLLASPHYGERWGRYWLDTARYADTIGGEGNARRQDYRYPDAWTYRDYVINAFNDDKPYDQFIMEQLAADKLRETQTDPMRLAALGFLTVGERFQNQNDVIDDRINVVSKGFLAMTVTCARCHDHMFDPIPTKDYYALHGVFASTIEPDEKPIIHKPDPALLAEFQKKMAGLEQDNRDIYYRALTSLFTDFEEKAAAYLKASVSGERTGKGMMAAAGGVKIDQQYTQALRGRLRPNDPVLGPFKQFAEITDEQFPAKGPALAAQVAANTKINPLVAAAFKNTSPASLEDVAAIYGKLFAGIESQMKAFMAASAQATSGPVTGYQPAQLDLIQTPLKVQPAMEIATTEKLRKVINQWPQQLHDRAGFLFAKINELELTNPGAPARAMVVADAPRPHDSPVFIRGQAGQPGELVPRHFLEALSNGAPQPFKDGSGRYELAKCIASKDNPLTARVMVNRIWMHHFGEGFVRTPDDLGNQAEKPTHPELLDWLSSYFMETGWSIKKMHRLIMLSRAYQESSYDIPAYAQIDPENRLLWRANIRRLDFEAVRDSLLVFGGRLDATVGGHPVNLTEEPYSFRRSVYGYIDRGNVPELMSHFDFGDPNMPNSKRTATVVPQQALFLMNSPMVIDIARRTVARPEMNNARNEIDRIMMLYRILFQRTPNQDEIKAGREFLFQEQVAQYKVDKSQSAQDVAKSNAALKAKIAQKAKGGGRMDATRAIQNEGDLVERKNLSPWEAYAQALLMSNEMAYVN